MGHAKRVAAWPENAVIIPKLIKFLRDSLKRHKKNAERRTQKLKTSKRGFQLSSI